MNLSAREQWDASLVTGNTRDFPLRPFVVTPYQLPDLAESSEGA